MPIYEPGLAELVARNTHAGRLHFSNDLSAAVAHADAVLLRLVLLLDAGMVMRTSHLFMQLPKIGGASFRLR